MKKCKRHRYKDQWIIQGHAKGVYQYALYKLCLDCDYYIDTGQRRQTKELPKKTE